MSVTHMTVKDPVDVLVWAATTWDHVDAQGLYRAGPTFCWSTVGELALKA